MTENHDKSYYYSNQKHKRNSIPTNLSTIFEPLEIIKMHYEQPTMSSHGHKINYYIKGHIDSHHFWGHELTRKNWLRQLAKVIYMLGLSENRTYVL